MAFDGTDRDWCPALPAPMADGFRLRVAQFGDGYAQRTLDGINFQRRRWQLRFEMKTDDVIADMLAYLEAQRGNSFSYCDPSSGKYYQVNCDEWTVDWLRAKFAASGNRTELRGTLSAEFVQAFGVTA